MGEPAGRPLRQGPSNLVAVVRENSPRVAAEPLAISSACFAIRNCVDRRGAIFSFAAPTRSDEVEMRYFAQHLPPFIVGAFAVYAQLDEPIDWLGLAAVLTMLPFLVHGYNRWFDHSLWPSGEPKLPVR